jgi:hypothetical protein
MQTDPIIDPEYNELADLIIQEFASLGHLRVLINDMKFSHKIAVAQLACNLIGSTEPVQHVKLKPFGETFDYQIQAAIKLMDSLPLETLSEIAIEILEEPRDQNE